MRRFFLPVQSEASAFALSDISEAALGPQARRSFEDCSQADFLAARQVLSVARWASFAVFQAARVVVGHIGDSRLYRLRGGTLVRITRDHSLLQEQLDAGLITPQQAATSHQRNLITRALGVEPAVRLDIAEWPVQSGDCFLLCSDGLTDMLDDEAIAQVFVRQGAAQASPPAASLATALVDQANARGGRDNISVLLVQADDAAAPMPPPARWFDGAARAA